MSQVNQFETFQNAYNLNHELIVTDAARIYEYVGTPPKHLESSVDVAKNHVYAGSVLVHAGLQVLRGDTPDNQSVVSTFASLAYKGDVDLTIQNSTLTNDLDLGFLTNYRIMHPKVDDLVARAAEAVWLGLSEVALGVTAERFMGSDGVKMQPEGRSSAAKIAYRNVDYTYDIPGAAVSGDQRIGDFLKTRSVVSLALGTDSFGGNFSGTLYFTANKVTPGHSIAHSHTAAAIDRGKDLTLQFKADANSVVQSGNSVTVIDRTSYQTARDLAGQTAKSLQAALAYSAQFQSIKSKDVRF